jgi:hypothetical protein
MPRRKYSEMTTEMQNAGGYCTDPVGKCLREKSAVNGVPKKAIDLCMRDSKTWAAYLRRDNLSKRFSRRRADKAWLQWTENFSHRTRSRKLEVWVDRNTGVFREGTTDRFGCFADVESCVHSATLIFPSTIWWCYQKDTWERERRAGVVCSSDNVDKPARKQVGDAKVGDIIVHCHESHIVAFSRAKNNGKHHNRLPRVDGKEYGSGWQFKTEYWVLHKPLHLDSFRQALIPHSEKYYPINKKGNGNPGYFYRFNRTGLQILLNQIHEPVPSWLEQAAEKQRPITKSKDKRNPGLKGVVIVNPPKNHKSGYVVYTKSDVIQADNIETALVKSYERWLKKKDRKLLTLKYNKRLQCDRYEVKRRNLIEAKASTSRENIRMAVGQLLDYAFLGKQKYGQPNKAILLPKKPDSDLEKWLRHLDVNIIWRQGESFKDNADGQFS